MVAFGRPLYRAGMVSRWLIARALWSQLLFDVRGADEERMRRYRESALRMHAGLGPGARERDRARDPDRGDRPDRLRRSARPHPGAPGRGPSRVPRLGVTGGDRRSAGALPRSRRGDRQPRPSRRPRSLHRRGRVLQLRALQGRSDARRPRCATTSTSTRAYAYSDSATDLPMLEVVGHPVAVNPDRELAARGTRARLGRAAVQPRRAAARSREHAAAAPGCSRRRRVRHCRRARRRGLVAAAPPDDDASSELRAGGARHVPPVAGERGLPDGGAQASCSFFTAKAASARRTTRTSSFFMAGSIGAPGGPPHCRGAGRLRSQPSPARAGRWSPGVRPEV